MGFFRDFRGRSDEQVEYSKNPGGRQWRKVVPNSSEKWKYVWGHAEKGCVDCSGAFVYAYRQFGKTIYHGSNMIARKYVDGLLPITEAKPGMAAFKIRKPSEKKYALPSRYKNHRDQNDYYHIGLVDEDGKHVLNAQSQSAGFTRTPISKWGCVGTLKDVEYGESPIRKMIVTSENGLPVRVRKVPSKKAGVITKLNVGTPVLAGEESNGWREIIFAGEGGYMMSRCLRDAD